MEIGIKSFDAQPSKMDLAIAYASYSHTFQAGEYFILACIMAGAAFLFMLLSIFYYEYVDPEEFENVEDDNEKSSKKSIKEEDVDSGVDEDKNEEKTDSITTDF